VAVSGALAAGWAPAPSAVLAGAGALGLVAVVAAGVRRRWAPGPTLAHLGLVVLVLGVAGSTATRVTTATLAPGEAVALAGHRLTNVAHILLEGDVTLRPQLIGYPARGRLLAETSARRGLLDDVQVALRSADDAGHATIEVHVRPLAGAVWLGAALLVAGGLWAALAGRRSGVATTAQRTIPPRRQAPSNSASTGSPATTGR
jgi:cytochrome c biogenesis factor